MNLGKRPAMIGNAIQSRAEMHGDEPVTAIDIPLTDIMLDPEELAWILREPLAHRALFNKVRGGIQEPLLKHIKPVVLADKIEKATITITHGVSAEELCLTPVNLAKIKLEPRAGGLTAMSCTVQAVPDLDDSAIAHLLERLNSAVEVEIDGGGFGKQKELELHEREEDEDGEEKGEGDEPSARAAPKKERKSRRRRTNGEGSRAH